MQKYYKKEYLYIDEEMARDKGHMKSGLKQVIKGKPEQEGAKIYCRCGPDTGLLHQRFSTSGPRPTGGLPNSFRWAAKRKIFVITSIF